MTESTGSGVEVRPATYDDLDGMRAVGLATWPSTYGFAGKEFVSFGLRTWWSVDALARCVRDTATYVAIDEHDTIIGVGNLDLRESPPVIWKLYVHPGAHGRGVGTALLGALIARAGDTPVRLEYVDGNHNAARFYAQRGFEIIDRQKGDRGTGPDLIWAQRPVRCQP